MTCYPADVRDAVEGRRVPFRWEDPQNPHKALVTTEIDGRPVLIVLFPAEDELGMVWNLGSAYHLDE